MSLPVLNLDLSSFLGYVFSYANTFIQTLGPIQAIGVGISFAVALLGFMGAALAGAFRMRGSR